MSYKRYTLNSNGLCDESGNQLPYISEISYSPGFNKGSLHTHSFTEIMYVVSGSGYFITERNRYEIKADDMVVINPKAPHTESAGSSGMNILIMGAEGFLMRGEREMQPSSYFIHSFSTTRNDVNVFFQQILHEVKTKDRFYDEICDQLMRCLVLVISRLVHLRISIISPDNGFQDPSLLDECRIVKQYLEEHFSEDITLQTLAELTAANKYSLSHAFKQYMFMPPIQYLIRLRIKEARNLLETSDFTIAQIASYVGFSSQSHFAQTFKKLMQVSPKEYRAMEHSKKTRSDDL